MKENSRRRGNSSERHDTVDGRFVTVRDQHGQLRQAWQSETGSFYKVEPKPDNSNRPTPVTRRSIHDTFSALKMPESSVTSHHLAQPDNPSLTGKLAIIDGQLDDIEQAKNHLPTVEESLLAERIKVQDQIKARDAAKKQLEAQQWIANRFNWDNSSVVASNLPDSRSQRQSVSSGDTPLPRPVTERDIAEMKESRSLASLNLDKDEDNDDSPDELFDSRVSEHGNRTESAKVASRKGKKSEQSTVDFSNFTPDRKSPIRERLLAHKGKIGVTAIGALVLAGGLGGYWYMNNKSEEVALPSALEDCMTPETYESDAVTAASVSGYTPLSVEKADGGTLKFTVEAGQDPILLREGITADIYAGICAVDANDQLTRQGNTYTVDRSEYQSMVYVDPASIDGVAYPVDFAEEGETLPEGILDIASIDDDIISDDLKGDLEKILMGETRQNSNSYVAQQVAGQALQFTNQEGGNRVADEYDRYITDALAEQYGQNGDINVEFTGQYSDPQVINTEVNAPDDVNFVTDDTHVGAINPITPEEEQS